MFVDGVSDFDFSRNIVLNLFFYLDVIFCSNTLGNIFIIAIITLLLFIIYSFVLAKSLV